MVSTFDRAHPRDLRRRRTARSILPARLAGAARGVAFGPTRSRLACVTGGAWRHARLRARSRRRRFDRRSHGRRVHAKQHAANDEALLVTAAFDMRFGHSRDANEVSAALLRLVPQSGKRAVVRALGPVETAPATIHRLDRSEAFRPRRGGTLPDVDRFGAPCDRRRLRLAGDQQSDEPNDPAGTHAPQSTHRGGLSPMPSSASRSHRKWVFTRAVASSFIGDTFCVHCASTRMARWVLAVGNKNYSSWSLRPWLALKHRSGVRRGRHSALPARVA